MVAALRARLRLGLGLGLELGLGLGLGLALTLTLTLTLTLVGDGCAPGAAGKQAGRLRARRQRPAWGCLGVGLGSVVG